jgi:hypothetical protein
VTAFPQSECSHAAANQRSNTLTGQAERNLLKPAKTTVEIVKGTIRINRHFRTLLTLFGIMRSSPIRLWLRRTVCILGGGAAAYAAVFVVGLISYRPADEAALTRLLAMWAPAGAFVGCVVGALVVLRAERLEAR